MHTFKKSHIDSNFDDELESIRAKTLKMGKAIQEQLSLSLKVIKKADLALAQQVIDGEEQINNMEKEIDDDCVLIIAKRQPTASDLRFIISVGRIVGDLERMGDEINKIAVHAKQLVEEDPEAEGKGYSEVRNIGKSVKEMLDHSIDAFAKLDADMALEVMKEDEEIDQDYASALRELATYMMEDPRSISRVMNIMWVVRSLERIADHAENLCEQTVYVVRGQDIRHKN